MGPFTYYAPLWLGTVLAGVLYVFGYEGYADAPTGARVMTFLVYCPSIGIELQLLFIAFQGIFAQVLPVPRGRSTRGRPAVVIGGLYVAGSVLAFVGWMFVHEGLVLASLIATCVAGVCFLLALLGYIWNIPSAVRDFDARVRRLQ